MHEPFRRTFRVRWGDLDSNGHMGNSAYLDVASDVRMHFFDEHGFLTRDGKAVARVTSSGGWLDPAARKLAPPPRELADAMLAMTRTPDFAEIPQRKESR